MKRTLLCLLVVLGLIPQAARTAPAKQPKLLVAIVIDQFRYDYLTRFRSEYVGGLARMLDHGADFTDAHLQHFPTVTAIGHSTFLSGATPSISGIVGNEWYDRDTKKRVTSVSDDQEHLTGITAQKEGSSPRRLLVSTIPDELKMSGKGTKTIGVSIKDRAAILPSGHMADGAYWFDEDDDAWVSSTYYGAKVPGWVEEVNSSKPGKKFTGEVWKPLFKGNDGKPFCKVGGGDGVVACGSVEATPYGNELIESFAEQALMKEQLGKHAGVDVLTVSFSANDYVGHRLGPDAPEVHDMCLRTDRLLGKFLEFVEKQVGPGNALFVLTADHGVAPVPEVNAQRKMPGGRLSLPETYAAITNALTAKYGEGKWIVGSSGPVPYLNYDLMQSKNLNRAEVERLAADTVRAMPHIFRVYTREQIVTGQVPEDYFSRAVRNGFYLKRSGDIFMIPEGYYLFEQPPGTSHGTPFNYDTHVPVLFMGPGIKPGTYDTPVVSNDIAPTLAVILGVEEPSGSVGRILNEILE